MRSMLLINCVLLQNTHHRHKFMGKVQRYVVNLLNCYFVYFPVLCLVQFSVHLQQTRNIFR